VSWCKLCVAAQHITHAGGAFTFLIMPCGIARCNLVLELTMREPRAETDWLTLYYIAAHIRSQSAHRAHTQRRCTSNHTILQHPHSLHAYKNSPHSIIMCCVSRDHLLAGLICANPPATIQSSRRK
jgi:hypothetical protein